MPLPGCREEDGRLGQPGLHLATRRPGLSTSRHPVLHPGDGAAQQSAALTAPVAEPPGGLKPSVKPRHRGLGPVLRGHTATSGDRWDWENLHDEDAVRTDVVTPHCAAQDNS